jgi:ankyrin repeat protein
VFLAECEHFQPPELRDFADGQHSFLLTVLNVEFVRPKLYAKDRRALPRCLEYLEESTRMSKLREIGFNERARNDDGRRVYDIKVLDNAYRINLERITNGSACESDTDLAEKVFSVLLTATRLLTIEELQHAVCAIQDLKEPPDFKLLHEWEALQGSCGGLIQQDQAGFVTFMHSSLQVFLDGHYEFFGDRERWMSRACSRYLASKSFSDGICKTVEALQTRLKDWPFLLYAAHYWRQHFGHKDVHPGVTPTNSQTCDDRCESATELFLCNGNVAAAAQIRSTPDDLQRRRLSQYLAQSDEQKGPRRLKCSLVIQEGSHPLVKRSNLEPNDTAGLHWACELGCTLLFRKVTIQDHKLDRTDWLLYTPLHYAAMTGCAEIVRDLINMGAQPDIGNVWKMTPLALAARNGHVCVVQSLLQLKGKVNVNSSDHNLNSNWSETVLPLDATIDSSNVVWTKLVGGRTPLHHAARDNRVEVVELLLADERTNVNHVDGDGFTALHRAAKKGNVEVVKLSWKPQMGPTSTQATPSCT